VLRALQDQAVLLVRMVLLDFQDLQDPTALPADQDLWDHTDLLAHQDLPDLLEQQVVPALQVRKVRPGALAWLDRQEHPALQAVRERLDLLDL